MYNPTQTRAELLVAVTWVKHHSSSTRAYAMRYDSDYLEQRMNQINILPRFAPIAYFRPQVSANQHSVFAGWLMYPSLVALGDWYVMTMFVKYI